MTQRPSSPSLSPSLSPSPSPSLSLLLAAIITATLMIPSAVAQSEQSAEQAELQKALRQAEEEHNSATAEINAAAVRLAEHKEELSRLRKNIITSETQRRRLLRKNESTRASLALAAATHARLANAISTLRENGAVSKLVFLAKREPLAAAWHWGSPQEAARAMRLLTLATAARADAARRLEKQIRAQAVIVAKIERERNELHNNMEQQALVRAEIERQLVRRAELIREDELVSQHARAVAVNAAAQAKNLRELIAALAQSPQKQLNFSPATQWRAPSSSPPSAFFGEGDGIYSHGLVYPAANNDGIVIAPFDGEVAWAAPFKQWGLLVILDHGGDSNGAPRHSLLAGIGRVEVVVGQRVLGGEPLAKVAAGGQLYWELRVAGQPRDPAGFLNRALANSPNSAAGTP
ncbi:MAG: peptidoglycan DD-metalloendopeptidase family protein [Alphaproteobacteria bacterium]|nr:peptidoglycan DD-metalloendopeptidase family protein [Alphaproteobacteria bacterium]